MRFPTCHITLNVLPVQFAIACDVCHDIGAVQRVAGRLQGGTCHPRTGKDASLYLTQFHAEAAYLHQSVATSGKQQVAFGIAAHVVARTEASGIFRFVGGKRVVGKDIGSQFGMVQITAAELRARHPQFAHLSVGHLLPVLADYIQAVGAPRLTDGHVGLIAFDSIAGYHTATLRRAIDVQECESGCRGDGGYLLTTHREAAQRRTVVHGDKLTPRHGAHNDVGDGIVVDELRQTDEVEPHVLRDNVKRAARCQRAEDVVHGGHKRETGVRGHAAAAVEPEDAPGLLCIVADVSLLYHAALGLPR